MDAAMIFFCILYTSQNPPTVRVPFAFHFRLALLLSNVLFSSHQHVSNFTNNQLTLLDFQSVFSFSSLIPDPFYLARQLHQSDFNPEIPLIHLGAFPDRWY